MRDKVTMKHPDLEGTATATRQAFETVWEPKGWVETDPATALVAEATGHETKSLGSLSREELDAVAIQAGLDPSGLSTKGEVVALIESTLNKEQ
jgi:hypothetical protein